MASSICWPFAFSSASLQLIQFYIVVQKSSSWLSFQCLFVSEYQLLKQIILKMEDKPAGKKIAPNDIVNSPKKVHNPIGSQSQWSFGWQGNSKQSFSRANNSKGFNSYHNQSSILLGETNNGWKSSDVPLKSDMKKKTPVVDKPVWNYDPKAAGKTTMILGTEKTDYRKKDQVNKERTPTTLTSLANSRRK